MNKARNAMTLTLPTALAMIIAATISATCNQGTAPKKQVREWIAKGALIVDVRTPGEFSSGHYNGAINIPLADIEKNLDRFGSRDGLIVVYCRTGNRSGKAKAILEKNGFKNVINGGGLKDMP